MKVRAAQESILAVAPLSLLRRHERTAVAAGLMLLPRPRTFGLGALLLGLSEAAATVPVARIRDTVSWSIILDCGSTGTRVHLYEVSATGEVLSEFIPPSEEDQLLLKTEPGIADFAAKPGALDQYLKPLLQQANRWVPAAKQTGARIRALATAGMRMLSATEQRSVWIAVSAAIEQHTIFDYRLGDAGTYVHAYTHAHMHTCTRTCTRLICVRQHRRRQLCSSAATSAMPHVRHLVGLLRSIG